MTFRTHGGARRGAGRKARGSRPSEKHRLRPRVEPTHPLHVVIRVVGGIRLRRRAGWRAIRHAMGVALARHDFRICHVSIQVSRVHLIVEADDKTALARRMQGFQIACARRFNRYLRRKGTLFSDRYHPVPLRSPQHWRRHGEDRFAPGVVMDPYSSARSFAPWHPRPRSETHPHEERLPVVVPCTWMLGVGWKRHRPISPRERPGTIEPPQRIT
jgi:hypothetical protein